MRISPNVAQVDTTMVAEAEITFMAGTRAVSRHAERRVEAGLTTGTKRAGTFCHNMVLCEDYP
jgi:hypothetical protein